MGNDTLIAAYGYDALGRRVMMAAPARRMLIITNLKLQITNDELNVWGRLFEDSIQFSSETDGDPESSTFGATRRWFVYGNGIDEPLIMVDGMATGEPKYYYIQDHLNSTAALIDEAGEVAERYEYDAYGRPTVFVTAGSVSDSMISPLGYYQALADAWLGEGQNYQLPITNYEL